jgi:hypothetical protein
MVRARWRALAVPAAIAAAAATAGAHLLDFSLLDLRSPALDADVNWSISDTISVVAIAVTTIAVALVATTARSLMLLPLIGLLAFLVADDAIQIHERIGKPLELAIVLPAALLLLWFSYTHASSGGKLVRLGLGLLACSFVLGSTDHLIELLGWSAADWQFQLKVAIKQAAEIAGWILIAFGAALAEDARRAASRLHGLLRPRKAAWVRQRRAR